MSVITIFGGAKDSAKLIKRFDNEVKKAKTKKCNVLVTRASQDLIQYAENTYSNDENKLVLGANTIVYLANRDVHPEKIGVVSAGVADDDVREEAELTLLANNFQPLSFPDIGVNNWQKTMSEVDDLNECCAVISIQGFEGALPVILAGLVSLPIISVPTSTGYGVADDGLTALRTSLSSCTEGISVVNVDNGFGGAECAIRIANQIRRYSK